MIVFAYLNDDGYINLSNSFIFDDVKKNPQIEKLLTSNIGDGVVKDKLSRIVKHEGKSEVMSPIYSRKLNDAKFFIAEPIQVFHKIAARIFAIVFGDDLLTYMGEVFWLKGENALAKYFKVDKKYLEENLYGFFEYFIAIHFLKTYNGADAENLEAFINSVNIAYAEISNYRDIKTKEKSLNEVPNAKTISTILKSYNCIIETLLLKPFENRIARS